MKRDLRECFRRIFKQIKTECKICGKECNTIRKLSYHIKKEHNFDTKKYYDKFYKDKKEGFCLECGKKLKFRKLTRGYGKYCSTRCAYKSDIVKKNREKTNLELYGVKNCYQSEEKKKKIRQRQEELYGGIASGSPIIRKKIQETNIKKYGVDNIFKNKNFQRRQKERIQSISKEKWKKISKKMKETKIKKYGDENYCNVEQILRTKREKYGDDWMCSKKMTNTKRKNVERFEKEHNCIERCKVLKIYGCPAILKDIKMIKNGFRKFILNSELEKIENYINNGDLRKGKSKAEKEVLKYIRQNFKGKIEENSKKIISPLELDIYIPKIKLAVEYNGNYWHRASKLGKLYHFNKTKECKNKGIRLIHIFEDDWNDKKEVCKSILLKALKKNKNKISIKKCKIKYIDEEIARRFIKMNDICGIDDYCNNRVIKYIGIYKEKELLCCIVINDADNQVAIQRIIFKPFIDIKENILLEIIKFVKKKFVYLFLDNIYQDIQDYTKKKLKIWCVYTAERMIKKDVEIFNAGTEAYIIKKGDIK